MKLYKSYGVLAHEFQPVYSVGRPASDIYDVINAELPEGYIWGENITGQTLIINPNGDTYLANDVLTSFGDAPAIIDPAIWGRMALMLSVSDGRP